MLRGQLRSRCGGEEYAKLGLEVLLVERCRVIECMRAQAESPYFIDLLWTPAQRKRASMLYFANVYLFIYLFFMAALFSGPG